MSHLYVILRHHVHDAECDHTGATENCHLSTLDSRGSWYDPSCPLTGVIGFFWTPIPLSTTWVFQGQ